MHATSPKAGQTAAPLQKIDKPRLSMWQIWNMSFGFLGIQFGFALQNTNMPRILQTLGAGLDQIGYLMIAAPLAGLIVQPIIGYMSDRTWGRFGRRRPYFFIGAVLAALSLFGMPHANVLWMAAMMLLVLDAAINIAMEPFRAFVGDQLPKEQVAQGFAFQTFFIGIGAVVASALPWLLTNVMGVANTAPAGQIPDSVVYSFYLGGAVFFAAVLWTVLTTKEYSPEEVARFNPESTQEDVHASNGIAGFFRDYKNMPKIMVQLSFVQFFTWFTWFAMWTYGTAAITQHIYGTNDTTSALYNEGASWWGICGSVYNGASIAFAFLLPVLAKKISRKGAHAVALVIGGLSLISVYFMNTPAMVLVAFVGVGLAWASTLSMPYAILACAVPARKMGMFMGMFNMSIVIPQGAAGLIGGVLLTQVFEGQAVKMLMLGGVSWLIAAVLSMRVQELD